MKTNNEFSDHTATTSLLEQNRVIPVLRHITHDLNNSVWSILANLEVIEQLIQSDDQSLLELLTLVKSAAERASNECRQATSILKETTANRKPVELTLLIDTAACFVRRTLSPNIALIVGECDTDIVTQTGYSDVLLLLWSLVNNSAAAIGDNQGEIHITLSETKAKDFAVVTLTDNGGGMDARTLADCKEAFAGVDKKNLGIGLTAVAETMYSHRGKVDVESAAGVGTTFRLYFPK